MDKNILPIYMGGIEENYRENRTEITQEEVNTRIKRLKNRKSPRVLMKLIMSL